MKDKLVYLCLGIAATLMFFVFREEVYSTFYYASGFNDQLWNLGLYNVIALITIGMSWGGAALYYYAINSVRWDRWWHWLAVMAVVVLLTPSICYGVNIHAFTEAGLDYQLEAISFELSNLIITAVLFVVASFSMRWWSTNCRHTPIPQ